ncbi:MAG: diguanylate cyclase [Oxalobacter sp.]|nr:MAG: diguanylate cyclase [Oxalobacter sp.]
MHSLHPESEHAKTAFVWDQSLATGIANVDTQHKKFFELTEKLRTFHHHLPDLEQVQDLLHELDLYAIHHFHAEEMLMEKYDVSQAHRNMHLHAHQSFVSHLGHITQLATSNLRTAVDLLFAFLSQWLLHHIAIMDMLLAEEIYLAQRGSVVSRHRPLSEHFTQSFIENINSVYRDLADRTLQMMEQNLQLQMEIERRKEVELALLDNNARFRTMADHAHSWEYWIGSDGKVLYMSPSCLRITGYTPDEFKNNPDLLYRIIHPDDRKLMDEYLETASMQDDAEDELGIRIIHRDGSVRWIIHSCKYLYSPNADFLGQRISNRDITNRQLHNDSMLLVANVFESINEAAIVTDQNNRIIVVNTAFSSITGYEPEEVIGHNPTVLAEKPLPIEQVDELMRKVTSKRRWQGELNYRRKSGAVFVAAVSIDSIRDRNDNISNFIIIFSDISERKESEQRIQYLSNHDLLTALPNWKLFSECLQQTLDAAKSKRRSFSLMYVDIDRFKHTKDHLGHEMSDLLLKQFAERLRNCLPHPASAARIGSDEFVVLLPNAETAQQANEKANAILHCLKAPFVVNKEAIPLSASIGISLYPQHGKDAPQLMKSADLAVFQAKRAGGALAKIFEASESFDV